MSSSKRNESLSWAFCHSGQIWRKRWKGITSTVHRNIGSYASSESLCWGSRHAISYIWTLISPQLSPSLGSFRLISHGTPSSSPSMTYIQSLVLVPFLCASIASWSVIVRKKKNSNFKLQKLVPPINSKWFEDKDRETVLFVDHPATLAQPVV